MPKVFISYSHQQGDWVWERLVPVLEAGSVEVLIDRKHFEAGRGVIGQADAVQDQADRQLLILSDDYLGSDYCRHELDRAVAKDPNFSHGLVIPVIRRPCNLPNSLTRPDPLRLDLEDDSQTDDPWARLLAACGAELGTDAPHWLDARDRITRFLEQGQSVNLVVGDRAPWRPLLDHLRAERFPQLALVDLSKGSTASRRGLLQQILNQLGHRVNLPSEPEDLAEFDRLISGGPRALIALTRFDLVRDRNYGIDLFAALRYLMMEERRLVLLAQSRTPFAGLLPRDHPLSEIDIKTVELRGVR